MRLIRLLDAKSVMYYEVKNIEITLLYSLCVISLKHIYFIFHFIIIQSRNIRIRTISDVLSGIFPYLMGIFLYKKKNYLFGYVQRHTLIPEKYSALVSVLLCI